MFQMRSETDILFIKACVFSSLTIDNAVLERSTDKLSPKNQIFRNKYAVCIFNAVCPLKQQNLTKITILNSRSHSFFTILKSPYSKGSNSGH